MWKVFFLFLTYNLYRLLDLRPGLPSSKFLSSSQFVLVLFWSVLRMVLNILLMGVGSPDVYSFDGICAADFGFEKFSRSSEVRFYYFFIHLRLFDSLRGFTPVLSHGVLVTTSYFRFSGFFKYSSRHQQREVCKV